VHRGAQFWPIRPLGDPKTQLTLGHGADAHLGHGNGGHPHLHGAAASEEVAHGVGVEHVERWHLEKLARLRRGIAAIDEKIFRYLGGLKPFEKAVPGIGLARQNHVAGGRILADENLLALIFPILVEDKYCLSRTAVQCVRPRTALTTRQRSERGRALPFGAREPVPLGGNDSLQNKQLQSAPCATHCQLSRK